MSGAAIDDVAAQLAPLVPEPLAAFGGGVAAGPGGPETLPVAALREPAVFDAVTARFGAGFGDADPRAVVSYWSQFYLATLATPALTALVRLGRALPLALDAVGLDLDAAGRPARLLLSEGGRGTLDPSLDALVEGHLRPFVDLCHARCGLAPRVVWCNAAVILDHVARELARGPAREPAVLEEAGTALGWRGAACSRRSPLAQGLCPGPGGAPCRRVCCLRYRLPGVASCGALCPVARRTEGSC
ncbi:siderophore-iron reductase FhuF [Methylobacterium sp. NEAU 140]|uniref:siderophore-iron reductase FhuF n=1 Tax=Methylobacterium sp. NEAU 140 TaxID=3064945 RepID=UPI002734B44F|nr:siderophore-iron reductase FhuF [Methylobacterium sp. NEAU 140]MDP4022813.1 siderophore-iron reductase FhuF [Methylobacterium sp. NEAU 140]